MKIYLPFKTIPNWFPYEFIYKHFGFKTCASFYGNAFLSNNKNLKK